jgi:hypothetical protein
MQTSISFKICLILFLNGELKSKDIFNSIKKKWKINTTYESLRSTVYRMEKDKLLKIVCTKKPKTYVLTNPAKIEMEIINKAFLNNNKGDS